MPTWMFVGILGAMIFLVSPAPGGAEGSGEGVSLLREGTGLLSFDRREIAARVRKDLGLSPDSRVEIGSLPRHFHGPLGNNLSARMTEEGRQAGGRYIYLLNILAGGVARESFYIPVKVTGGALNHSRPPGTEMTENVKEGEGSLVHSGDTVRVTVMGAGFLIRFSGIAQGRGFAGERIPVINPVSGRSLTGLVTGHDQVVIRLSGSPS